MKLSNQTHQKLETFFRQYFADEKLELPESEIYIKAGAGLITKISGVSGITIGRHIFIKPILAEKQSDSAFSIPKNLLAHELTHVLQFQKMGFMRFLFDYLKEYFSGLQRKKKLNNRARLEAYWEISHEIEARHAAEEFEKWLKKR